MDSLRGLGKRAFALWNCAYHPAREGCVAIEMDKRTDAFADAPVVEGETAQVAQLGQALLNLPELTCSVEIAKALSDAVPG